MHIYPLMFSIARNDSTVFEFNFPYWLCALWINAIDLRQAAIPSVYEIADFNIAYLFPPIYS